MSEIKVDTLTGKTTANDITVTVGATATMSLEQGLAKAWVNFNGTGTIASRDSLNVSGLVDNGTGNYTASFTTSMNDVNYCVNAGSFNESTSFGSFVVQSHTSAGITTSSLRVINSYGASANTGTGARDTSIVYAALHGDLA